MTINVSRAMFAQRFADFDRFEQFGSAALDRLFDYFEELEECTGEPIECDVIAICCEWARYRNDADLLDDYGYLLDDADHDDITALLELLEERTTVLEYDGNDCTGYLVAEF